VRIEIYTDGAAINNGKRGSIGFAAVLLLPKNESLDFHGGEPCDPASSNRAELKAMELGLKQIREHGWKPAEVLLFSDSEWAVKSVRGEYNATTNTDLIQTVRAHLRTFPNSEINWLRGHCGHRLNERAHRLANQAARDAAKEDGCEPRQFQFSRGRKAKSAPLPEVVTQPSLFSAPNLSVTQARLDWIVNEGRTWQQTYVPAYLKWLNRLTDEETYDSEAMRDRLYEVGGEIARLKAAFHETPAEWSAREWTAAQLKRVRLEAQYEAISETLQRRSRTASGAPVVRSRTFALCGGSSLLHGSSPSTSTAVLERDPFLDC
jgi:ribonuclease HI